jgi:hypothetical protein
MTQAVSRRPLTAETRARSQATSYEICGGQSGTGTGFTQYVGFSLSVSFHKFSILIFVYILILPEGQTSEAWELKKSSVLWEIRSIGEKSTVTWFSYSEIIAVCSEIHTKHINTVRTAQ